MRVLITGGAGFIGSHIADRLAADGHSVVLLDALLPQAHRDSEPPPWTSEHEFVAGDVRDGELLARLLPGVDAVCHQAALVGHGLDPADAPAYATHNDYGTAVLLAAMHAAGIGRLVLAGSMVVYGEGRYRCPIDGVVRPGPRHVEDLDVGRFEPPCPVCAGPLVPEPVPEDHWLDPRNVYAATKLSQELLSAAFAREHPGVTVTALRYHNVYGPRMPKDTPYAGVAAIFRSALERGAAPEVFEDGGQRRDFVHVRDVARANLAALTHELPSGTLRAFNVASGHPHTVGQMAAALAEAFGGPEPEVTGEYRLGDVRHVVADPGRAAAELGFTAGTPFADGMREFATAPLRG